MKSVHYIFSFLFLLVITLPLVFLDRKSAISEQENRTLAAFPDVIDDGKLNTGVIKNFPSLFDEYLNDRIGFKNKAAAFINKITRAGKFTFLHGPVVVGKNGWLFYSEAWTEGENNNIFDFLKTNLFSEEQIEQFIVNIENRAKWCDENGIKFIFLIPPNKHNIYPEYYPLKQPGGLNRTDQIMNALPDNLKDIVIYPRDYIMDQKSKNTYPLYHETDTHWNSKAAYYAYELLYEKIKLLFPNVIFPEIAYKEDISVAPGQGDLVRLFGLEKYGSDTEVTITQDTITENYDKTLPKAIIFNDSFFAALALFTSTLFSSPEYNSRWFTENEKEYILNNKPDILIWEVVERHIVGIPDAAWN